MTQSAFSDGMESFQKTMGFTHTHENPNDDGVGFRKVRLDKNYYDNGQRQQAIGLPAGPSGDVWGPPGSSGGSLPSDPFAGQYQPDQSPHSQGSGGFRNPFE